jgi:hypothetical protein
LIFGIVGLVCLASGIWYYLKPALRSSWCIRVYREGFTSAQGQTLEAFHWEQIACIWEYIVFSRYGGISRHRYTIQRNDGKQVEIDDAYAGLEELGDTIKSEVNTLLFPKMLATYQAGDLVSFGPLSLSQQGVFKSNGEMLPWSQVKNIRIISLLVMIIREETSRLWFSARSFKVANLPILLALLKQIAPDKLKLE